MKVLYFLKGLLSVIPILAFLFGLSFLLNRYKKRLASRIALIIAIVFMIVSFTGYLPGHLADSLERKYKVYQVQTNVPDSSRSIILVLGSGYTLDSRLPPNSQLGNTALARLVEGIRVHKLNPNSLIVASGYSPNGKETQAQVTKRAAILLGIDAANVATLDKPTTTQEEAIELRKFYDTTSRLIIVTDAIHMPRAMQIFTNAGYIPTPAPTNYKMTVDAYTGSPKFLPSFSNVGLMNYVIHEWLGSLKARWAE